MCLWPWLALPVSTPDVPAACGWAQPLPLPGPAWPCLPGRDSRTLPVRALGFPLWGQVQAPLHPSGAGGDHHVSGQPESLLNLEQRRAGYGALAALCSLPPLPRPLRWLPETPGSLRLCRAEGAWLVPPPPNQLLAGHGSLASSCLLVGWGNPACAHRPAGQRNRVGQTGLTACSVARSPCLTSPQEQR